jgi:hypothetical protein
MYNMKRKVIIEALPKAKTGQQVGGSLFNTPALMGGVDRNRSNQQGKATRTIGAVPRDQANLEAEGGETVVGDLTGIGIPQHYTISGPRHAQGGVPMDLPDNSFIFSDFNQMTIKDPVALEYFGKAMKKGGKVKGYTPAEIAKQYDNNKNIEALKNKNSDHLDRKTAELNLSNNNLKLGALALFQEAKKGFENGIPELSYPYLEKLGVNPEEMFGQQEQGLQQAKKGGSVKKLKRKQDGGMMPPPEMMAQEQAMGPEMMGQPGMGQQDPMQEVMMMVQQMMEQGAAPEQVVMELLNNQVPPDVIVEVFIQMGMPQEQAVQIIQAVMSQEQPMGEPGMEQPMDPAMMQGQGMTPDMMPAMDPGMAMMQMGGPSLNDTLTQEIMNALEQGASPEEVLSFLTQQGMSEQEAMEMVMPLVQRSNFETQPSMYKGGELPKAQSGYTFKTSTDAFGNPIRVTTDNEMSDVEIMQKSRPGEGFGKKVQDVDKFMEVHSWYFNQVSEEEKAKFKTAAKSGKESSVIKQFQKDYNDKLKAEAKARNLSEEQTKKIIEEVGFTETGPKKLDGKFGAFTSSRPFFDFKPITPGTPPDDNNNNQDPDDKDDVVDRGDINVPNVEGVRAPDLAEWTAPDIYNFRGAIRDRLGIKSYYPWAARFSPEFMDPTFYDPSRELAASAEQANMLTQGMGQFAGPQALSARASQIQGQGAKQAADIMGKYNNLNVGLANQFEGQNTQIANQAQQYNQAKAQELYDKGVITQQQRDNAIRQADATIRQGFQQGWKNASDIAMINANQEQYKVDPFTGTAFHTGVQRPFDPVKQQADYDAKLTEYYNKFGDPAAAVQAANTYMRTQYSKPSFAKGGYVLGANMFPFMFY